MMSFAVGNSSSYRSTTRRYPGSEVMSSGIAPTSWRRSIGACAPGSSSSTKTSPSDIVATGVGSRSFSCAWVSCSGGAVSRWCTRSTVPGGSNVTANDTSLIDPSSPWETSPVVSRCAGVSATPRMPSNPTTSSATTT